jgi:hypothetical protein
VERITAAAAHIRKLSEEDHDAVARALHARFLPLVAAEMDAVPDPVRLLAWEVNVLSQRDFDQFAELMGDFTDRALDAVR